MTALTNNRGGLGILVILSTLMAFASISTDLYLPALPDISATLHAGGSAIDYTISGFLIGFSLGQLVWGPLGDRYGRRIPIAIGLLLFIIGSAGCAWSASVPALIGWRAVQAIGACASVVLARAIVRDLYSGYRGAQVMSTLMTVMAVAPLLGPSLGGQILRWGSWRMIFGVLVTIGLITLLALRWLPETLPAGQRNRQSWDEVLRAYWGMLGNRQILGYAGAGGFFFDGVYAYIAGTPFAYISYHHTTPQQYGLLFGVGTIGLMAVNQLNVRLVQRFGSDWLLRCGTILAAVAGACAAGAAWSDGGLYELVVPLFLFISAAGLIVANSLAGALRDRPQQAGAVSALTGAIQYGSGIAGSALVALLADGSPRPMAYIIAAMGIGAALCAWILVKRPSSNQT
ncbi:Bcr/CflA family efflux MFS transporter [Duganella sp. FT80W]|uniref:Bcr/CflA family efflux transporter n=1 Tax=Duganella guangzhouensis TaxID=2666084 RepID=A0A6I2L8B2_9BURK|nr:multidrug effflux MFS transporter [Duganella guangzhouensis]MRW92519.1 Bcr/CflA family efflux MFS transporter [Duganella guangzhouensis]